MLSSVDVPDSVFESLTPDYRLFSSAPCDRLRLERVEPLARQLFSDVVRAQLAQAQEDDDDSSESGEKLERFLSERKGEGAVVALKIVEQDGHGQGQPRDVVREAKLLHRLGQHPNVLALLGAWRIRATSAFSPRRLVLASALYPYTLRTLLDAPRSALPEYQRLLALALTRQLFDALAFVHANNVAHRDVCPSNVAIARDGTLVLLDFGIALPLPATRGPASTEADEQVEQLGKLHFQVGTGPYRAPELLFGARDYEPTKLDIWSAGASLVEFFLPFASPPESAHKRRRTMSNEDAQSLPDSGDEEAGEEISIGRSAFDDDFASDDDASFSRGQKRQYNDDEDEAQRPRRERLFQAVAGTGSEIALIGSIFATRGTPKLDDWPEANAYSSFKMFTFTAHERKMLENVVRQRGGAQEGLEALLRIIDDMMLVISAGGRASASEIVTKLEEVARPGDQLAAVLADIFDGD